MSTKPIPTEDEIRAYDNVPVETAARYIGMSTSTMYRGLQEERIPFGFAVPNDEGHWVYNISPEGLIKYKRGELPMWRLGEVQQIAVDGIERLLQLRTDAAKNAVNAVLK